MTRGRPTNPARAEGRRRSPRAGCADAILGAPDLQAAARVALDWLRDNAAAPRAVVCVVEREPEPGPRLAVLAVEGLPGVALGACALAPDEPLALALRRGAPVTFDPATAGPQATAILEGVSDEPWSAVPLPGPGRAEATDVAGARGGDPAGLGLLLLPERQSKPEAIAEVTRALGARLAAWRAEVLEREVRRLERDRALYRTVIDAVTDPLVLTDAGGRILVANDRAEELLSAEAPQSAVRRGAVLLNTQALADALAPRDDDRHAGSRIELPLVHPDDGQDLLFELLSTDVPAPPGTMSVLRDVSDLRRATEEIEENYRRLRVAEAEVRAERDGLDLVIDSVADPILVTDANGCIVLMNSPAEQLFAWSGDPGVDAGSSSSVRSSSVRSSSVRSSSVRSSTSSSVRSSSARSSASNEGQVGGDDDGAAPRLAPDRAEHAVRANEAMFSGFISDLVRARTTRWRGELVLVDPITGGQVPVEAIAGKLGPSHGQEAAIVTVLHDRSEAVERARLFEQVRSHSEELRDKVREATSELVRQNELLRRQALELEQASAHKSQFLANMSHELRTPLNAILGYTSLLLKGLGGTLSPKQQDKLGRVQSNAHHLLKIINDLLDISRIEAGHMPLHIETFQVAHLIDEVVAEVDPLITHSRLTFSRQLEPDLPEVESDRQKVKQVLLNLIANAIKFTPSGSVELAARWDPAEERLSISVRDTGIGIAVEDQARLFGPFQQVDSSYTRQYGGAGLGLAICRRIASTLAGRLSLESQPGEGSTFTLLIPRRAQGSA